MRQQTFSVSILFFKTWKSIQHGNDLGEIQGGGMTVLWCCPCVGQGTRDLVQKRHWGGSLVWMDTHTGQSEESQSVRAQAHVGNQIKCEGLGYLLVYVVWGVVLVGCPVERMEGCGHGK